MRKGALTLLATTVIIVIAVGVEMLCDRFRPRTTPGLRLAAILVLSSAIGLALVSFAGARDLGQWKDSDPAIRDWYQSLMQPDAPSTSCCGEADAYWADEIHVRDGRVFATITDDRDDATLHRPHVDIGTEIEIPDHKLKWDRANPTGHGIVFMSRSRFVFCYVQPGGV
jgi:hypothetical protein